MSDLIGRQDAIDAVSEGCQELRGVFWECKEKLLALPSEQPETPCYLDSPCEYQNKDIKLSSTQPRRKLWKWMSVSDETRTWYYCSECHYQQYEKTNFCPSCGADMRGKTND